MHSNKRQTSREKLPIDNGECNSQIVELVCLLTMLFVLMMGIVVATS